MTGAELAYLPSYINCLYSILYKELIAPDPICFCDGVIYDIIKRLLLFKIHLYNIRFMLINLKSERLQDTPRNTEKWGWIWQWLGWMDLYVLYLKDGRKFCSGTSWKLWSMVSCVIDTIYSCGPVAPSPQTDHSAIIISLSLSQFQRLEKLSLPTKWINFNSWTFFFFRKYKSMQENQFILEVLELFIY